MGMMRHVAALALLAVMGSPAAGQQPAVDILSFAINEIASGWTPYGPHQKARGIEDAGVQGGRAIRLDVGTPGANPWDDGVNAPITHAVMRGDPLVLAFWARAPKLAAGEAVTLPFAGITQSHAPYGQVVKGTPAITREWKMVELRGVADRDYPAGELQAALQLSVAKLTVDLGPVFVLDLKRKAAAVAPPSAGVPASPVTGQPMRAPAGAPTWGDEFDAATIDLGKWRFDTSRNAEGWYNHEVQYYAANRPANTRIERGALVIEARRETLTKAQAPDTGGQAYSSAKLVSSRSLGYGFYEVRATLPCGRGIWPAIWLLPSSGGWPDAGEIDIMEMVGWQPDRVHATIHSRASNFAKGNQRTAEARVTTLCTTPHDYQLDWQPDSITIGVDGRSYMRATRRTGDGADIWPFTKPYELILNVAVGGDWGGMKGIDDGAFPQRMAIDHVRYWAAAKQ